jgi:type III secretion protein Q
MQEQDARPQNQQAQEERPDEAAGSAAAAAAPDLADLELSVVFELGEKRLTLAELEQLRPGMTFDLGKGLAEPVTIRVNGTAVGTGEPVQVGDRVGVRIVKLS